MTYKEFEDAAEQVAISALEGMAEIIRRGHVDTTTPEWPFYRQIINNSLDWYESKQKEASK